MGVELESLAEAMSQLAKIGQELMRPEDDRDPMWRTIPVAKEIMVSKGIATRAPWENIEAKKVMLLKIYVEEIVLFHYFFFRCLLYM